MDDKQKRWPRYAEGQQNPYTLSGHPNALPQCANLPTLQKTIQRPF